MKMRNIVLALAVVSCAQAKDHKWLRHLAAAAVCAGQAVDLGTTIAGNGRFAEGNSMMAGRDGRPNLLKLSLVKGGICEAAIVLAETRRMPLPAVLSLAAPLAVIGAKAGVQNYLLLRKAP